MLISLVKYLWTLKSFKVLYDLLDESLDGEHHWIVES